MENEALVKLEAIRMLLAEGGKPEDVLDRITKVVHHHSLLCMNITADHNDKSVTAMVTFDHEYMSDSLLAMAQDTLFQFTADMTTKRDENARLN